ncbi:MAG: FxsA family protein [Roseinatronobacter sp.]
MWILLVFLAVPILEIALFVQIGAQFGVIGTLAEVFATAAIGLVLLRLEPHRNAHDVRAALDRDASPASPMAHSALRMIGAVLLVLPGFFTDMLGLLLLLPPVRMVLLVRLLKNLRRARTREEAVIIEGEYEHRPDPDTPPPPRLNDREKRD